MLTMLGLTVLYVVVTDLAKKFFYSRMGRRLIGSTRFAASVSSLPNGRRGFEESRSTVGHP